jgi:hypothetical protein
MIVPLVLYGGETWSLTLREKHKNGVQRKTFEHKREEMTRDWRRLYNEELHDLCCSPNVIRVMKYVEEEKCTQGLDLSIDGWRILKWILNN